MTDESFFLYKTKTVLSKNKRIYFKMEHIAVTSRFNGAEMHDSSNSTGFVASSHRSAYGRCCLLLHFLDLSAGVILSVYALSWEC